MSVITRMSEQEYRELDFRDGDHHWELWDGLLVEKPPMSKRHDDLAFYLGFLLHSQLDRSVYRLNVDGGKTRYTARNFLEPDVVVIPAAWIRPFANDPDAFNAYDEPLPLVVEIWSKTTGDYNIEAKLPIYRRRGDLEIWYLHPYHRTLTVWRRQPDGAYSEEVYTGGIVPVASLSGISIDFDAWLQI